MDGIEAHWLWFAAGLILAGLEMVVPGVYLMWLAMAALATGVITLVALPSLAVQVTSFIFLSLIFAFSARRMLRDRPIVSSDPLLNNRGGRMVGQTASCRREVARLMVHAPRTPIPCQSVQEHEPVFPRQRLLLQAPAV